ELDRLGAVGDRDRVLAADAGRELGLERLGLRSERKPARVEHPGGRREQLGPQLRVLRPQVVERDHGAPPSASGGGCATTARPAHSCGGGSSGGTSSAAPSSPTRRRSGSG